jgi:hypothetical protein
MARQWRVGQADRILPLCKVVDIPAGSPPLDVVVELPDPDGTRILARWFGRPAIAVDDYVRLQRRGADGLYDLVGVDGDAAETIDHGGLEGLGDDDHSQYLLAGGSRVGATGQAQQLTNGAAGRAWAFVVKNTSGAAAAANDVGYIDENGEYKTTTTQAAVAAWCVVLIGGADNADIYVTRRGRVTVAYTGSAPGAGDYLVTSTTAGSAQAQTTIRPEIFAVCLAAGSGGTVEVLLLTGRTFQDIDSSDNLLFLLAANASDFVSAIAAAGVSGDKIYYNAPSSGHVNTITPLATTELAKITIHNTTQGESAYIIATGADGTGNYIQVSDSTDISGWVATDVITARSQTNTANPSAGIYFYDLYLSAAEIPTLAVSVSVQIHQYFDTGSIGQNSATHPYEADNIPKRRTVPSVLTAAGPGLEMMVPLINRRYCFAWQGTGTGTVRVALRIRGAIVATP